METDKVIKPPARRTIGTRVGKLQVVSVCWEKGSGKSLGSYVNCICDCGNTKVLRADTLISEFGTAQSCGCRNKNNCGVKFPSVTFAGHRLYTVWLDMRRRCYKSYRKDYKHYGGRGIKVCDRWLGEGKVGFINFLYDMENGFEDGLELERLDVDGDYCPENCTWVCRKSQVNNLRVNRLLEGFGVVLSIAEWGYFLKFNPSLLGDRVNYLKDSRPLEDILTDTFKDRAYSLIYKGDIVSATHIWEAEGFTYSERCKLVTKHGNSVDALMAVGVDFEVYQPREKNYLTFDKALSELRNNQKEAFDIHLLSKIERQLKEGGDGI